MCQGIIQQHASHMCSVQLSNVISVKATCQHHWVLVCLCVFVTGCAVSHGMNECVCRKELMTWPVLYWVSGQGDQWWCNWYMCMMDEGKGGQWEGQLWLWCICSICYTHLYQGTASWLMKYILVKWTRLELWQWNAE